MSIRGVSDIACGVTLSRTTSNQRDEDFITLRIRDRKSGVEFLDVEMSLAGFGSLITGQSDIDAKGSIRWLNNIGKTHEHKYEIIQVPNRISYDHRSAARQCPEIVALLAPYEVDGWIGYADDLVNGHRRVGQDGYRVGFSRFVDDAGVPVV